MPGFDTTGPPGMGSMTGGGRGFCAGSANRQRMPGRGGSFGRGAGHGWRNCYYATGLPRWQRAGFSMPFSRCTVEDERESLKSEAEFLRAQLQTIEERLAVLNTESK